MRPRVGVLLSGCGAYDGSDLHESVLTLLALERRGARPVCIAPDIPQLDVVDHLSGQIREDEQRVVRDEAGRIARGKLETPSPGVYGTLQALILIGGFGVVKNLMSGFARKGEGRHVDPSVLAMLQSLHGEKRPVGAVGLGKTLLTAFLEADPFEGAELNPADQIRDDPGRRLYYAPGFLGSGELSAVAEGIDRMVEAILSSGLRVNE